MRVRPATPADADLLLAWRNDPDTVAWSRSPDPVARPEHVRWLTAVLADPARRLLIAEADGPVGTVRFDRDGDAWEVSITVAPASRGRGLAVPILAAGEATLEPSTPLVAWVHQGNAPSLALFERAGYRRDGAKGEWLRWTKRTTFDYDAELRRYATRMMSSIHIGPSDDVLDIGCGAGQTTRHAGSLARSALGVDIMPAMVARARALAVDLPNVHFEQADAQTHPFAAGSFSLAISRFGTMFFDDPVAAFTNIRRALKPGAPLVQLVWQAAHRQDWVREIRGAVGPNEAGAKAFSLADPSVVDGVLTSAGFADVSVTELAEPVCYGADPESAVEGVRALQMAGAPGEEALDRLRAVMAAHAQEDGVWFDSRAWLVRAVRPPGRS